MKHVYPPFSDTFIALLHEVTNNKDFEFLVSQFWNESSGEVTASVDLRSSSIMIPITPQVRLFGMLPRASSSFREYQSQPRIHPQPQPCPIDGPRCRRGLILTAEDNGISNDLNG